MKYFGCQSFVRYWQGVALFVLILANGICPPDEELNRGIDVFFRPYLFIISSPFSGIPSKPNESSISGAKVFPCSSRRRKVKPCRVCRKIFLFPFLQLSGRAYLFTKTLRQLNTTFFKLLKLEHSSPAPIRHSVKKKVRNYDTSRKKYETSILLPSN